MKELSHEKRKLSKRWVIHRLRSFSQCTNLKELVLPDNFIGFDIDEVMVAGGHQKEIWSPVGENATTVLAVKSDSDTQSLIDMYGYGKIKYIIKDKADWDNGEDNNIEASPASYFEYTENERSSIRDGIFWSMPGIEIIKYIGNEDKVVIPDEIEGRPVTAILESAFEGSELSEVKIPAGIVRIDTEAFVNCSNLKKVIFLNDAIWLGENCFSGCQRLKQLELPIDTRTVVGERWNDVKGIYEFYNTLPIDEKDGIVLFLKEGSWLYTIISEKESLDWVKYKIR